MFVGLGDFIRLLRSPEYRQGIAEIKADDAQKRAQAELNKAQGQSLESPQTVPSSKVGPERGH